MEDSFRRNPVDVTIFEQEVARWFATAHKEFFGNGPQGVAVGIVDNYFVIVANKVLNKFEKSLSGIPEGPYRIQYTRKLLFSEIKDDFIIKFEQVFNIKVKQVRYSVSVDLDKSLCIIVSKDKTQGPL